MYGRALFLFCAAAAVARGATSNVSSWLVDDNPDLGKSVVAFGARRAALENETNTTFPFLRGAHPSDWRFFSPGDLPPPPGPGSGQMIVLGRVHNPGTLVVLNNLFPRDDVLQLYPSAESAAQDMQDREGMPPDQMRVALASVSREPTVEDLSQRLQDMEGRPPDEARLRLEGVRDEGLLLFAQTESYDQAQVAETRVWINTTARVGDALDTRIYTVGEMPTSMPQTPTTSPSTTVSTTTSAATSGAETLSVSTPAGEPTQELAVVTPAPTSAPPTQTPTTSPSTTVSTTSAATSGAETLSVSTPAGEPTQEFANAVSCVETENNCVCISVKELACEPASTLPSICRNPEALRKRIGVESGSPVQCDGDYFDRLREVLGVSAVALVHDGGTRVYSDPSCEGDCVCLFITGDGQNLHAETSVHIDYTPVEDNPEHFDQAFVGASTRSASGVVCPSRMQTVASKADIVKKPTAAKGNKDSRRHVQVSKIKDAKNELLLGNLVWVLATKLDVLREALSFKETDPLWKHVKITVNKASKLETIELAIANKIPVTSITWLSANLDVCQRAAELLGKDQVMCVSHKIEVMTAAVALLGEDRVRNASKKPEVLRKAKELLGETPKGACVNSWRLGRYYKHRGVTVKSVVLKLIAAGENVPDHVKAAVQTAPSTSTEPREGAEGVSGADRDDAMADGGDVDDICAKYLDGLSWETVKEAVSGRAYTATARPALVRGRAYTAAGAKAALQDPTLDRLSVTVSNAAELSEVLEIRDQRLTSISAQVSTAAEAKKVLEIHDPRLSSVSAKVSTAAEAAKVLEIRDPRLKSVSARVTTAAEAAKVLEIRDPRLSSVSALVSTATEARRVIAMRLLDQRVRSVAVITSRASEAAKALKIDGVASVGLNKARPSEIAVAASLSGIGRLSAQTSTMEGAEAAHAAGATRVALQSANVDQVADAAASPIVDYAVHATVRPQFSAVADRLGLNFRLLDGAALRASAHAWREQYRRELQVASIAGVLDERTRRELFIAVMRQVGDVIRPLNEFFDAREADGDVQARFVIYVGIGADERCLPPKGHVLKGHLLPRSPESIAWSDRPESVLVREVGGRFGKTRWADLLWGDAARIYATRADINHGVTETFEDVVQRYVRRRLPNAPSVISANGDRAFGGAGGSGRRTRGFVAIVDVERAQRVLRESLIVVPRVSLAAPRDESTVAGTLALFRAGDPARVCAALERACALASGEVEPRPGTDLVCKLKRRGLGQYKERVVYWASYVVDGVWIRSYGMCWASAGRPETAFALASDFGPSGGAAAKLAHERVCRPKENPPPSRRLKPYEPASEVPFRGIARLVESFEEMDDEALIAEAVADEVAAEPAQPRGLVAAPPLASVAPVADSAVPTFVAPATASLTALRTPLREHFHGLARNVADQLDVRTDQAEDVAAQMHAVGDAVTADSLAGAVRRLRFQDEED